MSDREATSFGLLLKMPAESSADMSKGFVGKTYVPFFTALVKAGHGDAFAHLALAPLGLSGTDRWMGDHASEVAALKKWLSPAQ